MLSEPGDGCHLARPYSPGKQKMTWGQGTVPAFDDFIRRDTLIDH